jgi:hypothetical protein
MHCCIALIACMTFTLGITSCGGNSQTIISSPPATPADITGNWELSASVTSTGSTPLTLAPAAIGIYLTSNAGSVSGIAYGPPANDLLVFPDGCVGGPLGIFNDVVLTGTVDSSGNLKLGTAAGSNPAFAMTGTVGGSTISSGSFTLECSTSAIAQGTITGVEYPALNGTYAGTLTSQATGQSFTMTMALNQGSAPNSYGVLSLTGTVNVSGYSYISATAMSFPSGFTFVGNAFAMDVNSSSGEALYLTATLSADGKTLPVTYGTFLSGSGLTQDYGAGTLTLQ